MPEPHPKILILYNTRSGHRRVNFQAYLKALAAKGAHIEMKTLGAAVPLADLLKDIKNFDRVVIAGGDGTVATAAGVLENSGIPLIAYPGGTANLLARNLGMPTQPEALAEVTISGKALPTDIGELEYVRYSSTRLKKKFFKRKAVQDMPVKTNFSIMAGCGFTARLMSQAAAFKSVLGEIAYWLSALFNLFPKRSKFKITLDGKEIEAEGIGILIVNFEKIQFDLKVVSGSEARDGKLEIMIVKARSLFGLLPVLWSAVCERFGWKRWRVREVEEIYQASDVTIKSDPPVKLQFDGEILKKSAEFRVRCRPAAALFVYGPSSPHLKVTNLAADFQN